MASGIISSNITPSVSLSFRQKNDLRSNNKQAIILRYYDIKRDKDVNNVLTSTDPNYSIFNARYIDSNDNLINFNKWYTDLQIAKNFSKVSFNYEYRRLFESNRQLNLRFFTGAFLKNSISAVG